jgi:hypothetical protein
MRGRSRCARGCKRRCTARPRSCIRAAAARLRRRRAERARVRVGAKVLAAAHVHQASPSCDDATEQTDEAPAACLQESSCVVVLVVVRPRCTAGHEQRRLAAAALLRSLLPCCSGSAPRAARRSVRRQPPSERRQATFQPPHSVVLRARYIDAAAGSQPPHSFRRCWWTARAPRPRLTSLVAGGLHHDGWPTYKRIMGATRHCRAAARRHRPQLAVERVLHLTSGSESSTNAPWLPSYPRKRCGRAVLRERFDGPFCQTNLRLRGSSRVLRHLLRILVRLIRT